MRVLILKNVSTEGPGTIEDYLRDNGIEYSTVDLQGESFPAGRDEDALILMGGPMSVNEADTYLYIAKEIELARIFMNRGKKVLGICLGAQIMAKALGARVYAGSEKEIGWHDIELQEEGVRDSLMKRLASDPDGGGLRRKFKAFHWHGETFDLPEGAAWLAKSESYPHQAFRYGSTAYALQFHIEVRKEMVYEWLKDETVDMKKVAAETEAFYNDYYARAVNFYKAFFDN